MLPERHFMGWDRPFGAALVDWLWERKEELSGMLIVVPTAQSGRRIREQLAERGAVLAPRVVTTGFLMRPDDFAPESVETLAWSEVFSGVKNWNDYRAVFPVAPEGQNWELGLAKAMVQVRAGLQENGLLFGSAAKWLEESPEAERWQNLAKLERQVEELLKKWGFQSKNAWLARGELSFPPEVEQVVLAGVLDLPRVGEAILEKSGLPVRIVLTGEDHEEFDAWGRPVLEWNEREVDWPEQGSVTLAGDSSQQAMVALEKVADGGMNSGEVVLGTGDEEVSTEFVQAFGRSGWVVHDPGSGKPSPLAGWLHAWRRYLGSDEVGEVLNLLAFPQSGAMAKGKRAQRAMALSQLRDEWLVRSTEDIERVLVLMRERLEQERSERTKRRLEFQLESAQLALGTMTHFESWRAPFIGAKDFHGAMRRLLAVVDPEDEAGVFDWLDETAPVAKKVKRKASFWLELLLQSLSQIPDEVPDGRVLDVQGWLELLHDPAPHLVVCGMNEGRIPGKASTDTWLPEVIRKELKLAHDGARAARDAYILTALMRTRETGGRVDLIAGKSTMSGDVLQPSRLLLAAKGQELARRVKVLFQEVEPADTGLAWTLEDQWKWRPRVIEPKSRVSVTNISAYLTCPFRYYLERVVGMSTPEPERVEWSSRDFGNVMHDVLEAWGSDEVARDFEDPNELEKWFFASLDEVVASRFGGSVPLAVQFQIESMRQRFSWMSKEQAKIRAAGWRVIEVEKEFSIEIEGTTLTGKIDRIDQHVSGAIRVLDYKTGIKAKDVMKEHLGGIKSLPVHLEGVDDVLAPSGDRWTNVQVPLYAAALERVDEAGYFALGETEAAVKLSLWADFGEAEKDSALKCSAWVLKQIREQVFWPPAAKEKWGTFSDLSYGRPLEDAVEWNGGVA
ncbi:MAG: PD-(D/E)XK nuclease family protein [Akkermansiaceae bacterium]